MFFGMANLSETRSDVTLPHSLLSACAANAIAVTAAAHRRPSNALLQHYLPQADIHRAKA